MSLIELMIALTIGGILLAVGLPYMGDYVVNSRLRAAGEALFTEALYAQSEAIKRNGLVRLTITDNMVQVLDATEVVDEEDEPTVLRERTLPTGVSVDENTTVSFSSEGRPDPLAETTVGVYSSAAKCSGDYRCPALIVEAGGAVRLCNEKGSCE